jgi:hypothetical protein
MNTKHTVMELKSEINELPVLLTICSPSQKVTITDIKHALTPHKLKLLRNLKVNEINFEFSFNFDGVTSAFLDQLNSLPHSKKFVSGGYLSFKEKWSNEKFTAYRHLFREGKEPEIQETYSSSSIIPQKQSENIEESEQEAQDIHTLRFELKLTSVPSSLPRFEAL